MANNRNYSEIANALVKAGWEITADPYILRFGDTDAPVELSAEKLLAAEREGEKILVIVKSFIGQSPHSDLYSAVGQHSICASILSKTEPDRKIYLAVGKAVYDQWLETGLLPLVAERLQMGLLVARLAKEEIIQWNR